MMFKVLKKDLTKKKALNIIMLVFIILATTFFAGSTNCLIASTNSLDRFMEVSNAPDLAFVARYAPGVREKLDKIVKDPVFENPDIVEGFMINSDWVFDDSPEKNKLFPETTTIILQGDESEYGILFDENDNRLNLKKGEIALPVSFKSDDVKLGNTLIFDAGNGKRSYKMAAFVKDAMFGSDFMGLKRIALCREDYEEATAGISDIYIWIGLFSDSGDAEEALSLLRGEDFGILLDVTKSLFKWTYILNLIISVAFIIVSICLILIAFLALRFTIIFTLNSDFREIGVMKAIGIKNRDVRKLYISKYVFMAVIGAAIGFVLSFPFEQILLREMSKSFVSVKSNLAFVNVICAVFVVLIISLFCYRSTGKLKKFSAIDAIRSGETGERFRSKSVLKLEKRKKMPAFLYLALNDILSNPRKFLIMLVTFSLCILLLMPTANSAKTLRNPKIIRYFSMTESEFFLEDGEKITHIMYEGGKNGDIEDYISEKEKLLADNGIDARVNVEIFGQTRICAGRDDPKVGVFAVQGIGTEIGEYDFLDGTPPKLPNEIAMTKIVMDELGVKLGDSVYVSFGKQTKKYIVTASFQSMNNLGRGVRFAGTTQLDLTSASGGQAQIRLNEPNTPEIEDKLLGLFGDKLITVNEYIDKSIGSIPDQLDSVTKLILLISSCICSLIAFLMVKSFIIRERGEIAMLKSVGFKTSTIRAWQVARIALIVVISAVLASLISIPLNKYVGAIPFRMMGAQSIDLTVDPLEVYVFYPAIFLAAAVLAALLATVGIKKIRAIEVNNME